MTSVADAQFALPATHFQRHHLERLMPKFVIERNIAGAGRMSPAELRAASQKSCGVLNSMGPSIQWQHSYVTDDKLYCVYLAPDEAAIHRHAELSGFPADRVSAVKSIIDPATAE
ncbi:DUF4242 domain-containing protein [Ideonella sp. DXS29W]|uniref:DUF4242 domain-containing protein n=1 Tax=Ideonella lacteola TaxID=2984193 RepID=A0ABU9BP55_9BURK